MSRRMEQMIRESSKAYTKTVDGYIERCDALLNSEPFSVADADSLRSEIGAVYVNTISGFSNGLNMYPIFFTDDPPRPTQDEIHCDIVRIKAKLETYRDALIREVVMGPQGGYCGNFA